ncbi:MAG: hypothetical protein AAFQ02_02375 [Bacteroidota bacterium]
MRRTLREYLDDPALLREISLAELEQWSQEVPYASLIHRLMVLKAVNGDEKNIDVHKILRNAVVHSSDPSHIVEIVQSGSPVQDESVPSEPAALPLDSNESESLHQIALESESKDQDSDGELIEPMPEPIKPPAIQLGSKPESLGLLPDADEMTPNHVRGVDVEESLTGSGEELNSQVPLAYEADQAAKLDLSSESTELGGDSSQLEEDGTGSSFTDWLRSLQRLEEDTSHDEGQQVESKVISEGLAMLLAQQGHISESIDMYRALQLRYPEKSSFFAAQIENLESP